MMRNLSVYSQVLIGVSLSMYFATSYFISVNFVEDGMKNLSNFAKGNDSLWLDWNFSINSEVWHYVC